MRDGFGRPRAGVLAALAFFLGLCALLSGCAEIVELVVWSNG